MRHRHQVVEIDAPVGGLDDVDLTVIGDLDDVVLIDETSVPTPILPASMRTPASSPRSSGSAVPSSRPIGRPSPTLPWGLGTDGWPRHNSRLVRLFACDPDDLVRGVAGLNWGPLHLTFDVRASGGDRWVQAIPGTLQMPYRSRPLDVELRVQPFHDRYSRVDVVLCSRHRWPRRYFDVASCCLTMMQRLERTHVT